MSVVSAVVPFLSEALLATKPVFFGISGPQGSGKLFLAAKLVQHLAEHHPHLKVAAFSIDDFYLTHSQQAAVTRQAKKEGNAVMQGRGLPGTHDVGLLTEVLLQLALGIPTRIPIYDKSAFSGEGDRVGWRDVDSVNIVLFEGWFNGFSAVDPLIFRTLYLTQKVNGVVQRHALHHMEELNAKLKEFDAVWRYISHFVYLVTSDIDNVYKWRCEQEEELISKKGAGMTPEQVHQFVDRYMPMYALYYERMCCAGLAGDNLAVHIDSDRRVMSTRRFIV